MSTQKRIEAIKDSVANEVDGREAIRRYVDRSIPVREALVDAYVMGGDEAVAETADKHVRRLKSEIKDADEQAKQQALNALCMRVRRVLSVTKHAKDW
jgi:imidazoleglycerol phosphate dehydratase HisB